MHPNTETASRIAFANEMFEFLLNILPLESADALVRRPAVFHSLHVHRARDQVLGLAQGQPELRQRAAGVQGPGGGQEIPHWTTVALHRALRQAEGGSVARQGLGRGQLPLRVHAAGVLRQPVQIQALHHGDQGDVRAHHAPRHADTELLQLL